jgi:hypothetical protein
MESLAALGLASNILQVVDFSSRIISKAHELRHSATGLVEEHSILDNAARNLTDLYDELYERSVPLGAKHSDADQQLRKLQDDSQEIARSILAELNRVKLSSKPKTWHSIYLALNGVLGHKRIYDLTKRLEGIRKEVDTTLLFSIRYSCTCT